jgi:TM2 domain-containing membrane protein YozV
MSSKKPITYPTNSLSIRTAYILFILFGVFGAHHLYLGNPTRTIFYFFTAGVNALMVIALHGFSVDIPNWLITDDHWFFYFGFIFISPLILTDLVTLPRQVAEENAKLD